jgi:hypothetical protein
MCAYMKRSGVVAALLTAACLTVTSAAEARIIRIQIIAKESPTFGGYSWPGVGQYEKIVGKAFAEISPTDPKNSIIVDLALAPRNARGNVEYSFDFYILKPIDLSKGNHKVMYEPPNRGRKTVAALNRGVGGNDPGSVTDAATLQQAFLMPQGYTLVFSGWDFSAGTNTADFNSTITLPIAKNADGSSIVGPSYEFIVMGDATTGRYELAYPTLTRDKSKATLTHRRRLDDRPMRVSDAGWEFVDDTHIRLLPAGTAFKRADIYEFVYSARDPTVNGIGFAAVRDWNAWLRYETKDDAGTANPLAGDVTRIYTEVSSQPGRFLNDFRNLGFNQAENGKIVFDGHLQWIAAGDGINMNLRFSQPGRTERNRQDHLYAEGVFPFAHEQTTDPITHKTAGRYDRCAATNTCPLAMEIYSANEYWAKAASLMHTDPSGKVDLPGHPKARYYFMSSMQHGTANGNARGLCQQFGNPLDSSPVQRALFVALDLWATKGIEPPPSMLPRLSDGTLQPPLPQAGMGFPDIPGVLYTGLKTTRYRFDYGPRFDQGIMDINPPAIVPPYEDNRANGAIYPSYVPKTDADGNDIAGVRLPDVTVPLNTYTGWSLRANELGDNDGCEAAGQRIPFAKTKAERIATGDPRLSIEERYPTFSTYAQAARRAIDEMVARRLLLHEDAAAMLDRLLRAGQATGAIKMDVTAR